VIQVKGQNDKIANLILTFLSALSRLAIIFVFMFLVCVFSSY